MKKKLVNYPNQPKKTDYFKVIAFLLLLVFYGSLLVYKIQLPYSDDMARHVKNGELIVHGNFDIAFKNVYSFSNQDYSVVNHHWLSGVVYYLLFLIVGWGGLEIFKVVLLLCTFALLFKVALKKADFWLVAALSLPTILVLMERSDLRPENFSYLFVVFFLYLLSDLEQRPESKKIYWLIPLQLIWVNLHIFFFVGLGLVGGFLTEKIIENHKKLKGNRLVKKLSGLLLVLVAACFINPNTVSGALYPLNIFKSIGFTVNENLKLFDYLKLNAYWADLTAALYLPIVALWVVSLFFGFRKKQKPVFYFLATLAAAIAGFLLLRSVALFALMFLPAAAVNFQDVFAKIKDRFKAEAPRIAAATGKILAVCLMLFTIFLTLVCFKNVSYPGVGLTYRSMDSAQFFKVQNLKGPIFNDYDSGSYLLYNLYPQEKVFVDNRPEAYPISLFKNEYLPAMADDNVWQTILQKYNFNMIFFYQYDATDNVRNFIWRRVQDPAWALVYVDIYNIILVKNVPQNQAIIGQFHITPDNAQARLAYLVNSSNLDDQATAADTFDLLGLTDLGTKTFLDVLAKDPTRAKLWMILGEWELGKTDPRSPLLASMFLDKAISMGEKTSEAYSFLGAAYVKLNRPDNARAALEESLRINPYRADARKLLAALAKPQ